MQISCRNVRQSFAIRTKWGLYMAVLPYSKPFYSLIDFIVGKKITSRIAGEFVSSMTRRSMP